MTTSSSLKEVPIPILCYHSVSDRPDPRIAPFAVHPDDFARHLDLVAERNMRTLTISALTDLLDAGDSVAGGAVAVTFDDGYADVLGVAAPMLAARGLTATVYLTTAPLPGCPGSVETRSSMIPYGRLLELESIGMEIGSHTHTHPELDVLPIAAAAHDIRRGKELLERALWHGVRSFAYPHGYASRALREVVRRAGFDSACGVRNAFSHAADDRFLRARLTVRATTHVAELGSWLDGLGAPVAGPNEAIRTTAWRAVRRVRARLRRCDEAGQPARGP